MHEQRGVGDHLVIDELIALGQHDAAVDHQHLAEAGGLQDLDLLEGALFAEKHCVDLETEGRPDFRVSLAEIDIHRPLLSGPIISNSPAKSNHKVILECLSNDKILIERG